MPRPIRFHLDEHVNPRIALGLRRLGIDVTTTHEAGLDSETDPEQLAYCLAEGRVIVTHDYDYLELHGLGVEHAGIAYCHQDLHTIGQLVRSIELIRGVFEPGDMRNRVEYL